MGERCRFEREMQDLGIVIEFPYEFQAGPITSTPTKTYKWPTVMFEFDVHYGFHNKTDAQFGQSTSGMLTTHTKDIDFFDVKRDGIRIEIGTKHFKLSPKGLKKIETVKSNISSFVAQIRDGCKKAKTNKRIKVEGWDGHPAPFLLPNANPAHSGVKIFKLPGRIKKRWVFTGSCSVWASPQAHITFPLAKVGELVDEIRKSIGKSDGKALTGDSPRRMGVRSDHLFKAKKAVEKLRKKVITAGHILSNGTPVDATTFTDNLVGLLILQGSYLWVRDLVGPADYETYGKGHLPIYVKTPFSEIYTDILTDTERKIYSEILAGPMVRTAMFGLVRKFPKLTDGSTKLFPDVVVVDSSFTWDDLLDWTLGIKPLSYLPGRGTVWPVSKTKPRIALELRRIGFKPLYGSSWNTLIDTIVALTQKLN